MTRPSRRRHELLLRPNLRRTFGRVDLSGIRQRGLLLAGLVCLLATGAASADWRVYDETVDKTLQDRFGDTGTVTGQLNDANDKLRIKTASTNAGDQSSKVLEEPTGDEKLNETVPSQAITPNTMLAQRCPAPKISDGIPGQQFVICQEMVKTELAQYRFSLRMFKLAQERHDRLHRIEEERAELSENDYGDLLDNSNKLQALIALMDNDRDRYDTYMQAYAARLNQLDIARDLLSQQALRGSGQPDVVSTATGAAVLVTAVAALGHTKETGHPFD